MKAALLVLIASASASAAPCAVDVVRAPEGVREVVDHWVAAEPQCTATLEVRIVATKQGLYVIARDRGGHVHDRVVPDAQTAGVLIASWAADDSIPGVPAPIVTTPAAPAAIIATARPIASDPGESVDVDTAPPVLRPSERRWIRVMADEGLASVMLAHAGNGGGGLHSDGIRGSVGVWTHDAWTLDVSLDYVSPNHPVSPAFVGFSEVNAFANLGYALHHGFWSLTPSIGLGLRYGTFDYWSGDPMEAPEHDRNVMPVAQGSLVGGIDVTDRVQLVFGMSAVLHPDLWDIGENLELEWLGGVGVAM